MSTDKTPKHIKLDERNHVEKPLLEQLEGLGWDVLDWTDKKQLPCDTGRDSFTDVILSQVLRRQLKVINPWLDDDQVEEVVKQLTASFPSNSLIENNKHLLRLMLENTSVSENRQTGENSPTVRFVDFNSSAINDFTAVCQFKIRILGTEHHILPDITLFLNGLPVVVIECKSPKVKDAIPEAIDQLMRYSEQRGAKGEGSQPLFYYNQFVVATCRNECKTDLKETFPELNASPHVLVMTDEAHRSQYAMLGANLDKGIPNAARIGYTGTPIDKTERVFGEYIDKYTMRQSIEDGVTLEIVYEGRTHNAEVSDRPAMDREFADVFSEHNLQQRLEILGYGSRDAYLEAKSTIKAKAWDMVQHYLMHVFPNGYKAQVVATSREAAVRYKRWIDASLRLSIRRLQQTNPKKLDIAILQRMATDVIISGRHNDLPHLKAYSDKSKHEASIKSFKMSFGSEDEGITGDVGILIVN